MNILNENETDVFDLSFVFDASNRIEDIENAIYFCHIGFIELNETKEMSYFLMACLLLSV